MTAIAPRIVEPQQHSLQRLPSPSRGLSALLHSLGLASFAYSFSYLILNPNQINDSYGWHLQYLTIIGLSLATLTFTSGLLADLTLTPTLFQLKNALAIASAPMEILISILYWTIRAIDPKLVLPSWAPPLPLSTDISFHLIPSLALATDLLLFSPPQKIAFVPALGLSGCIAFGYWFWIERCYRFNGFYPYPLFEILGTGQRVGYVWQQRKGGQESVGVVLTREDRLFGFSALLMTLSTAGLVWLYGVVNGREVEEIAADKGKSRNEGQNGSVKRRQA